MEHQGPDRQRHGFSLSFGRYAVLLAGLLLAACGTGGDGESEPNTPLTRPMALVVNQDDTTLTTLRLDGKGSPVVSTLPIGPAQPDAIGGVTFSLGEWIFVTHTAENRVAFIDPIAALAPILEGYLVSTTTPRIGLRPKRIYRDPVDKEVLWTMNEGDPVTGVDSVANCQFGGSVTVLHNSHISVGGDLPHIKKTSCLYGKGEQFAAFSRPTAAAPGLRQSAFVSSKITGLITQLTADRADGANRWSTGVPIFLCNSVKEQALGYAPCGNPFLPNHSEPAGMFWSQATGKIYSYLSGYGTVAEIDPDRTVLQITRTADVRTAPLDRTVWNGVGITPEGRFLVLVGEDVISDQTKVIGKLGVVRLDTASPTDPLTVIDFAIPELDNIRPALFKFSPDGRRLYLTQSNKVDDLAFGTQAHNLKLDKLLVFDISTLAAAPTPAAPTFVAEIDLPSVGSNGIHGMDLWITGPRAAGSAKGVVVTNAAPGINGTVSLINAASHAITATIPVGRNPKQVTVYYYGLARSDNQATPIW